MKVALIQMEIAEKNTPGNIVHGLDLLQEAAANSDIAVLPEIWTTGYSLGRIEEEAEISLFLVPVTKTTWIRSQ